MSECSCPVCPLVKANVQVCDVIYEDKGDKFGLNCPENLKKFHKEFELLVAATKHYQTPIGSNWHHNDKDHECCVKRMSETFYKICFHAITSEEDPLAMD